MPIREPAKIGLDENYQKLLASYVEGKPDATKEIFIEQLKGVKLLVTADTDPKATMPKGVTALRNGKVLSADEFAGIREAVYTEARSLMNNFNVLKGKDGKAISLGTLPLVKGIDLDGKPEEFNIDEVALSILARMASKEGGDASGPAFDGTLSAEDAVMNVDGKQAVAMGGLVFDPKIAYIDKLPEPPKPIKIEGSAFKANELLQKGLLRMQYTNTGFALSANTADGKIDDATLLNMLAGSAAIGAGTGVKTIISTPADFPRGNIGPDGKPLDQASWLAANPQASLPRGFVEQILTRSGLEETLPLVMSQMDIAEKAGKAFTRTNLREAMLAGLHENFKLANAGKDGSDVDVLFGSGAISNDLGASTGIPNVAAQTTIPGTVPAQLPQVLAGVPTSIPSIFPASPTAPQTTSASTLPQVAQNDAYTQQILAWINAQNARNLGAISPTFPAAAGYNLPQAGGLDIASILSGLSTQYQLPQANTNIFQNPAIIWN